MDLEPTGEWAVRFCEKCRKNVHYCESKWDAEEHAVKGDCIAVSSRLALDVVREAVGSLSADDEEVFLGEGEVVSSPYELWARNLFRDRKRWWQLWR